MIGAFGTVTRELLKGPEDLEVGGTSGDHPNYRIIENGQNTEKSPGDLRETCCYSNSSERPSANADVKNSKGDNNNTIEIEVRKYNGEIYKNDSEEKEIRKNLELSV